MMFFGGSGVEPLKPIRCSIASELTACALGQPGQRVKADRLLTPTVIKSAPELVAVWRSCQEVGLRLGISKNTVLDTVRRDHTKQAAITG